ncbi:MAG: DUF4126 domain-containing protein [Candidatus Nanopelagicales bacterium]
MDPVTAVITGLGLAGAAGLNAYVPLLVVGLLGRLGVLHLSAPYDSLTDTPVLVVLGVLFAIEFLADKVPGVDSVNDVVQTVVRPAAGAVLMAGSLGIGTDLPPWVGVVAGIITAGGIHATKAAARPVVNVSTAGVGGPVVSLAEDAVSLAASLLAVLAPLLLIVFVAGLVWWLRRTWVRRREARALRGGPAEVGPGSVSPGP